ncbi:hypothetical protein CRG98_030079 [Punica granatum]|uniref:Uncharacterized protein n=1 Tax=Punica granatum TaxID=22663 RepID=A0A2I0IZY5_PUNGR|nr:hypothetical protein CRG98_030079 [Punica granatum]
MTLTMLCGLEFRFVEARMCATDHTAWECPPSQRHVMDTRRRRSRSSGQGIDPSSSRLSWPDHDGRFTVWTEPMTCEAPLVSRTRKPTRPIPTLRLFAYRLGSLQ